MSLLIESIKIFNGRIYNLRRHENRIQRSRVALISKDITPIPLRKYIEIPIDLRQGLVKCRIVYKEDIQEVSYTPYLPNIIESLKLVESNLIDYQYKYLDRTHIKELYAQRGNCDDIIMVKDRMLTDSSYGNIALLKDGVWYTPSTCLLNGTRRQQLIDQGKILEADIPVVDIDQYEKICLFNAMIGLNKSTILIPSIVK
ncbi:aminotransferase class IV [Saprospiraceae bacterium]|nr:aminotransferase class IV [Saprospiraceae bacterium]MDC1508595.1 aminotransferase class IV [Saprospiraceae bacterium]HAW05010.1 4-amino-4-deoxychorismate lyase [Saprospirales bacterium]